MAENKKSFLLYTDVHFTVKKLTDEQAGILFKHILSYVNDENPTMDNLLLEIAFEPIKQSLKRDLKRYETICKRNHDNGLKGGRPKKKPKKPSRLIDNPKNPDEPKKADSDSDNDIDSDIEEIREIDKTWLRWKDYKKAEFSFKYKSDISEQAAKTELINLSDDNAEIAIKIIEQSIANGWKGFFKLKANGTDKKTGGATNEQLANLIASKYASDK